MSQQVKIAMSTKEREYYEYIFNSACTTDNKDKVLHQFKLVCKRKRHSSSICTFWAV